MTRALFRFLLLGALLFAGDRYWASRAPATAAAASDEEVLFRRALALGLDRGDPVVQRRLLQNMAFLESEASTASERRTEAVDLRMSEADLVVRRRLVERLRSRLAGVDDEPSDAELQAYLDRHAEEYASPPLLRISHQILGSAPLPLPPTLPAKSPAALAKIFGGDFAQALLELPPGEWRGPLRSGYGLHLVRVEEITPPHAAALADVRARVRGALLAERAAERVERALRRLRQGGAG